MAEAPSCPRYSIIVLSGPAGAQTRSMLPIAQELNRRDHRITYITTQEFAEGNASGGVDVLVHEPRAVPGQGAGGREERGGPEDGVRVEDTLDRAESIHAAFADDVPDLVLYEDSARITARLLTHRWKRPAVEIFPSFAHGDFLERDEAADPDAGCDAGAASDPGTGSATGSDPASGPPSATGPDPAFATGTGPASEPGSASEMGSDAGVDAASGASDCVSGLSEGVRERLLCFVSPGEQAGLSPNDFCTRPEPLSIALLPREFQTDGHFFDSRVVFVGPCIPERRMDERWRPPGTGLPVVFFALDPELLDAGPEFVRDCIDAFAGRPLHVVIVADGNSEAVREMAGSSPHVEVHERVPRSVVLRCAAAFVCHSDHNSVMESLYFNTPLVAVPTSESERAVADRVVELGLGVRISPGAAGPQALVDAVVALVGDLETGCRVREFQRQARRAGGARRAADEIERYLEWIYQP
ncbi:hypothetical protein ACGFW5_27600 [Streptomyces sp. NPDC048416]|uniref:hypothetical protein n=1 Tax=Streptomyces sp. NPDC048416 TaxID=3365546 RepID=UPI003716BE9D